MTATLKSKKSPWAHLGGSLYVPKWLGGNAMIKSVVHSKGKLSGKYVRNGGKELGEFTSVARTVSSPGQSSFDVVVKERICESIYKWTGDIDLDVRLQLCGRVDDPVNWAMIKRLCCCMATSMGTDGETITDAKNDGETLVSVTMESNHQQIVIYRLDPKIVRLYDEEKFADYVYDSIVIGASDGAYYMPATDGIYSMYMLASIDNENVATIGSALLPHEPVSIASDNNVVTVVLSDGSVYWSHDYGKTFYAATGIAAGTVVSVYSYSNILVGRTSGIYRSTDGGRTFINADPYGAASSSAVAVCHHDDKIAYVLCDDRTVCASEDGGETFMKVSTSPVMYPKDMIILDGMLMIGGFGGNGEPLIYGSDDGGETWQELLGLSGSIFTGSFTHAPSVKLTSCGCGVVVAAITYNDNVHGLQHSEIYRNVNWGVAGCWEPLWEDYKALTDTNGLMFITDIECAGTNDVMAVGRILGADPLYFGLRFTSREVHYGKEW